MYPIIEGQIMKTRTADVHRQADRDRLARAAAQDRRTLRTLRPLRLPRLLPGLRPWPAARRPAT